MTSQLEQQIIDILRDDGCTFTTATAARIAGLVKEAVAPFVEAMDAQRQAASRLRPYIIWQLRTKSPGHHPTLPSAFAAFNEAFSNPPRSDKPVVIAREIVGKAQP
jgi:hypothetical protein